MRGKNFSIITFLCLFFVCMCEKKDCNFNEALINRNVFPNHACWKCYENLTDRGRLTKIYCLVTYDSLNFTIPGFIVNEKCIPFDHRASSISNLVQSSMSNNIKIYEQWRKCCEDALNCCEKMVENHQGENFFGTCDAHWNGFSCFQETEGGSEVKKSCPYSMVKNDYSQCEYSYTRKCHLNGTWDSPDYTQCHQNERLSVNNVWHISMLALSIVFCILQLFTFGFCKQCKYFRTLIALILFIAGRNLLRLILLSIILADPMTLTINSLTCRLLMASIHFNGSMIYVCLALFALKIFQILKDNTENWGMFIMMCIGLVLSISCTLTWSMMMKIYSNKNCWIYHEENYFEWINYGVQVIMVILAMFLTLRSAFFKGDKFDRDIKFLSKIFIIILLIFLLPFSILIYSSFFACCELEEFLKLILTFFELLQPISLSIILIGKRLKELSVPDLSIPWVSSKFESSSSLAPVHRDDRGLYSWHDVVTSAKHSTCYENDIGSVSSISTIPEPFKKQPNEVLYDLPMHNDRNRRHTIRHIMMRAKNNNNVEEITPKRVTTPPLPKNIPTEILDDVKLFDFYYKNLDSIFINDRVSVATRSSELSDEVEKRSSGNRISRMLSFGQQQQAQSGVKKLTCIEESALKT